MRSPGPTYLDYSVVPSFGSGMQSSRSTRVHDVGFGAVLDQQLQRLQMAQLAGCSDATVT
jgi:hypothetical protein